MIYETEKLYLFNPFQIKNWSVEQIEKQVNDLIKRYRNDNDTMYEMASNIEIMANITYLYGEMIARLTKEHSLQKLDTDAKENKQITYQRKIWQSENPNEKVPAMTYFEAKAKELVRDDREKQLEIYAQLIRFKQAYESYEHVMNAIKKKMESIKYEEFNK